MAQATHGCFVWYDLLSRDPQASVAFYTDVVGWTAQPYEDAPYTLFAGAQGPLGGASELSEMARKAGAAPHWVANVFVDDVDATAVEARELGGRVLSPAADLPRVGRLAVIADPQGAPINVFKPLEPMKLHDERPGEVVWNELITTDHEAAFDFHSKLFGWTKVNDLDMGPVGAYRIYGLGDRQLGGMFTRPKSAPTPPTWFFYVRVPELDKALERAKVRGATVMNGPMEVPGGARVVQISDPQGAAVALHEAPKG